MEATHNIKEKSLDKDKNASDVQTNIDANSNITYDSEVKITIVRNDARKKKLKSFSTHNNAKSPLFDFLLTCLTYYYDPERVPQFLYLLFSNNIEVTSSSLLKLKKQQIPLGNSIRVYYDNNNIPYLVYSLTIPGQFTSPLGEYKYLAGVTLYNSNNISLMGGDDESADYRDDKNSTASMSILFPEGQVVASDSTLFIDWKIVLNDSNAITN